MRKRKTAAHTKINIKKIILEYEDGTRISLQEGEAPIIGKLFFDSVQRSGKDVNWKVIEGSESFVDKIKGFFDI